MIIQLNSVLRLHVDQALICSFFLILGEAVVLVIYANLREDR